MVKVEANARILISLENAGFARGSSATFTVANESVFRYVATNAKLLKLGYFNTDENGPGNGATIPLCFIRDIYLNARNLDVVKETLTLALCFVEDPNKYFEEGAFREGQDHRRTAEIAIDGKDPAVIRAAAETGDKFVVIYNNIPVQINKAQIAIHGHSPEAIRLGAANIKKLKSIDQILQKWSGKLVVNHSDSLLEACNLRLFDSFGEEFKTPVSVTIQCRSGGEMQRILDAVDQAKASPKSQDAAEDLINALKALTKPLPPRAAGSAALRTQPHASVQA